jgi:tRNA dimethylallyltransferase
MSAARTAKGAFGANAIQKHRGNMEPGSVKGHDRGTHPVGGSRAENCAPRNEGALAPGSNPLALLLLGPTGSGKTALSLALAEHFPAEIVSCDSVAVYRGMDRGSAKPTPEERARVPHHLIDIADPDQPFTAGEYSRRARAALHDIASRNKLPIVTGGTGLYLRALTEGLFPGPTRREDLRRRLLQSSPKRGENWLHKLLTRLDPASAARIHPNDTPKLIRAIEVCLAARQPMSAVLSGTQKNDPLTGFHLLRIGLNPPRAELYARLNQRCAAMFASGLVDETRTLLAQYGPVKALDSLGYRQALQVIRGEADLHHAVEAAQQGHRNYAKRQLTWFRREPGVHWIASFGDAAETQRAAIELIQTLHPFPAETPLSNCSSKATPEG